jgi:hypothetical protein
MQTVGVSDFRQCYELTILFNITTFGRRIGSVNRQRSSHQWLPVSCSLKCDGTRAETKFRLYAKRTSPFKSAGGGGDSSVDYWQASCTHQSAGFVLLVQACVLQSCDAYWLPTPFSCFPFTSPFVCHRVPLHFKCILLQYYWVNPLNTEVNLNWI